MTTVHAFPNDWTLSRVLYTGAALIAGGAIIAGSVAFLADGAGNTAPVNPDIAAPTETYLAPHCERAATGGAENCMLARTSRCLPRSCVPVSLGSKTQTAKVFSPSLTADVTSMSKGR